MENRRIIILKVGCTDVLLRQPGTLSREDCLRKLFNTSYVVTRDHLMQGCVPIFDIMVLAR